MTEQAIREILPLLDPDRLSIETLAAIKSALGCRHLPIPVSESQDALCIDALSFEALKQLPPEQMTHVLGSLHRGLAAVVSAHQYASVFFETTRGFVAVHNSHVASWLKTAYSAHDISDLIHRLDEWGTFSVTVDLETGLVRTSEAPENRDMSERQWVTDGVQCGYWQKRRDPEGWKKNLCTLSAFSLCPESRKAAERVISNPAWYHERKKDGSFYQMRGMPHIFLPAAVRLDPSTNLPLPDSFTTDKNWFNQKRLESQALLLRALCEDFDSEDPNSVKLAASAAALLARYLIAVNQTPSSPPDDPQFKCHPPTAGSWEEIPFPGGMTSDIAQTVLAFESLRNLLAKETSLSIAVKKALGESRYARAFRSGTLFSRLISEGRKEVSRRVTERLAAGLSPYQNEDRAYDMSLTFLAASGYRLAEDPVDNARLFIQLIGYMESALLREHGMIRYAPHEFRAPDGIHHIEDSYLGIGYWLPPSLRSALLGVKISPNRKIFGSKDSGTLEEMEARQQQSRPDTEAQWCLGVSAILQGICLLSLDILQSLSSASGEERKAVLQELNDRIDYYVTRNLALISPENPDGEILKSNGYPVPGFQVIEAYEAMPSLDRVSTLWVPGAHPLSWGMAQLFDGLHKARDVKASIELLSP